MAADAVQFLLTVTASGLGAFAAGAVGYRYALAKFRRERTFDKQLSWSEKATATFIEAANKLNWAMASELAGTPEPEQRRAWAEAHNTLVGLRGLEAEAEMYASPSTYEAVSEAIVDITSLARTIWALSQRSPEDAGLIAPSRLYEIAYKMLYHAASRTAGDVREHLELPDLTREWRLYDKELRELRAELDALKQKGLDFDDGAWSSLPRKPTADSPSGEPVFEPKQGVYGLLPPIDQGGTDSVGARVPLQSYIRPLEVELVGSGPSWMIRWAGLPHIAWSSGDTLVIGFCPAAGGPLSP